MSVDDAWTPADSDDVGKRAAAAAKPAAAEAPPPSLSGFMLYSCRCLMQDRSLLTLSDVQRGTRCAWALACAALAQHPSSMRTPNVLLCRAFPAVISQWRRLSDGVKDKFNADAVALEGQFKLHLEVIALRDEHARLAEELEARKARRRRRFTAVAKKAAVADDDGRDGM